MKGGKTRSDNASTLHKRIHLKKMEMWQYSSDSLWIFLWDHSYLIIRKIGWIFTSYLHENEVVYSLYDHGEQIDAGSRNWWNKAKEKSKRNWMSCRKKFCANSKHSRGFLALAEHSVPNGLKSADWKSDEPECKETPCFWAISKSIRCETEVSEVTNEWV